MENSGGREGKKRLLFFWSNSGRVENRLKCNKILHLQEIKIVVNSGGRNTLFFYSDKRDPLDLCKVTYHKRLFLIL